MNPKDLLYHHINSILVFSGAKNISVWHPQLNDEMGSFNVGEFGPNETPIEASQVGEVNVFAKQDSAFNNMAFKAISATTLLVKITEEPLADSIYSNLASNNKATASEIASRRAPIKTFDDNTWFLMQFNFAQQIPNWLSPDQSNQQLMVSSDKLVTVQHMLQSTVMQMRLISEFLTLLSDPLTNLCSRTVLQNKIAQLSNQYSVGLIMVHCIDFHQINRKFGNEFGDNVIREIAELLKSSTRENDILSRYGGALFGVAFPVNEKTDVASFAKKLQLILQQRHYLDGAINLAFDVGAAIIEYSEDYPSKSACASVLISRADQALKAAQKEEKPSIITWHKDDFSLYQQKFNYLGGIFTADTITDYRNMLLLWDISSLIADKYDFSQLAQSVIQRLAQTFDFMCAGVIGPNEQQQQYLYSIDSNDDAVAMTAQDSAFLTEIKQMQQSVMASDKPSERLVGSTIILVLPLEIETADCLFICGKASQFEVKHDTQVLLSGLTRQLGKALRRSKLEEELNRKLESQNEQLQHELTQLKEGLQVSSIIYRSQAMANLLKHAKRAAMTDTTVLITGESGTGKERLINALHQMGNRNNKSLVIVDCGSIPESLIESELFGYVKGAFTGAQNTSSGKVLDAEGGILVLDEIGELPLNMQTKLLRFVQEKHFTPVGGNKVITVDVKIIAVTNRDLAFEVEQGNFRKDLYYRLNVLTLYNPPLRERPEDIELLATHFLTKYAEQFKLEKRNLSTNALQKMLHYTWPGNIRELENRLMQATLLCEGKVIEWGLLNIEDDVRPTAAQTENHSRLPAQSPAPPYPGVNSLVNSNNNHAGYSEPDYNAERFSSQQDNNSTNNYARSEVHTTMVSAQHCTEMLLDIFKQTLSQAGQHPQFVNAPFGSWIEDELIIKTYIASDRKMRLTAARLSISQSTARRKVDKILAEGDMTESHRPSNWHVISEALAPIANGQVVLKNCVAQIKLLVLESILSTPVYSMAQAAEMLGVSEPTFYKLKRELDASQ
ncbi:sigma 54-interacting transcriptional regulator [Aliiglaciecola sp. LCG003]|uniref:sigma 54-interacting transcriptional regulator n=1 Tax=Aliiglaciecola sp. LCG003 TaxID=3053655 RepID=UPI002573DF06|nr:sigma 54-interacting transcriptional regulator [Aliiglaciecola sp. LCG003]WJG08503.1 sigma 54-interacting transcriptional regulator [Aliiglaciecola sp. LCG003]